LAQVPWAFAIPTGVAATWAVVGLAGGMTAGAVRFETAGAAAAVGLAAVLAAVVRSVPSELVTPYAVAVFVGTGATALTASGGTTLPLAAASAVVMAAAMLARREIAEKHILGVLLVPAVVAGAAGVDAIGPSTALAVLLAVAGSVAAGLDRDALAAGIVAVAAAAAGLPVAYWLLAAAAVVVAAIDHRATAVVLLPAAVVALDAALAGDGVAVTAVAAATAGVAARALLTIRRPPRLAMHHLPAAAIAAGVLFVPHHWSWTGADGLDAERLGRTARGMALVAITGAGAVAVGWASGQTAAPRAERPNS
jgi:hypothetical protein